MSSNSAVAGPSNISGSALVGLIIVTVAAAVTALLFIAFRHCMWHTHEVAKERVKSLSRSTEKRVATSRSEDTPRYVYANANANTDAIDVDVDDEEKQLDLEDHNAS